MPRTETRQGNKTMLTKAIILDTKHHALTSAFIKIAYYPLALSSGFFSFKRKESAVQFYDPAIPLDAETMAKHHILKSDLDGAPLHTTAKLKNNITYIIGHSADDAAIQLSKSGFIKRPINTLKLAQTLVPDLSSYDLTTLSYYFAEDKDKVRTAMTTQRNQLTDTDLTAALLKQLKNYAPDAAFNSIESLYLFSLESRIPKAMTFGEHKGLPIHKLPEAYKVYIMKSEKLDHWLKLAVKLNNANLIRQTYEITNKIPSNTYSDYDFLDSTTPVKTTALEVLEKTLYQSLGIQPE